MPDPKFLGKKILFVVAHPDDESFTAAGTMLRNRQNEGENHILCVTFGEKGRSHLKKPITELELKKLRRQELERAAKYLKVRSLSFSGLPDTGLNRRPAELMRVVSGAIEKTKPDYVFGFGPDGISGHLDHIAAGKAARAAARAKDLPFIAFNASPTLIRRFEKIKARRRHGRYAKQVKHAEHNVRLRIDARAKLRVLRFHKSQQDKNGPFAGFSKAAREKILRYEYFRQ